MSLVNGHGNNDGDNHLMRGDYANIAGVNSPSPIHVPINGASVDNETPERLLISKERWEVVRDLLTQNPDLCGDTEMIMDHFSGYSWGDLGQRYGMSRESARHRVEKGVVYLRNNIRGKQF